MKFNLTILLLFYFLLQIIKSLRINTLPSDKSEDLQLDDKEIESMLKDPKFANIAGDLNKLKSSRAQMSEAGIELKNLDTTTKKNDKNPSTPKEDLNETESQPATLKSPFDKHKKNSSEELLDKFGADSLKDLEMDSLVKNQAVAQAQESEQKKKDFKLNSEEKFKNINFISKKQAKILIEILKQPSLNNILPQEAQQILKAVTDGNTFTKEENNKINEFIESSLLNTPNSQTFVDPDGTIGRKGILSILDPITGESKNVWTISNGKVLCFFKSQSFLTIVKLFRNSVIYLKDINSTPCFVIRNNKENNKKNLLVCAASTQEKEVWVQTVKANLGGDNL